jgi:hypothetical protein
MPAPGKTEQSFSKSVELSTAVAAGLETKRDSRFMQPVQIQRIPTGADVKRLNPETFGTSGEPTWGTGKRPAARLVRRSLEKAEGFSRQRASGCENRPIADFKTGSTNPRRKVVQHQWQSLTTTQKKCLW